MIAGYVNGQHCSVLSTSYFIGVMHIGGRVNLLASNAVFAQWVDYPYQIEWTSTHTHSAYSSNSSSFMLPPLPPLVLGWKNITKMMLAFFQKIIPSHDVINFEYIFPVLLVFIKPKHSALMMTFGLHENLFGKN